MELQAMELIDPRPDDNPWPECLWPVPAETILTGVHLTITAFQRSDAAELFTALDHDDVWTFVRGRPTDAESYARTLEAAPEAGRWPWVVRRQGEVVGTASYMEVSPVDARLEIGHVAYTPASWGTIVSPETMLLLLEWAFVTGRMGRVQLKTDVRNKRSQSMIAKLGAQYEGVLRRYQRRADSSVRDTVMYSVIAEEWPGVEAGLRARL